MYCIVDFVFYLQAFDLAKIEIKYSFANASHAKRFIIYKVISHKTVFVSDVNCLSVNFYNCVRFAILYNFTISERFEMEK